MCRVPNSEKNVSSDRLSLKLDNILAVEDVLFQEKEKIQVSKPFLSHKNEVEFNPDLLAVTTIWTKQFLFGLNNVMKAVSQTKTYRILCHTTQPAHLVTSVAVLFLAFLCRSRTAVATISPIWTLLYLGSFSAHFGAQIWMTFVSGLALYFSLPRHTFGSVQKVLFPKYFLLNAGLSFITLAIFLRVKNKELATMEITLQALAMSLCFLTELVIFLYLTPPLIVLISMKNEIEKEAGVGLEVGKFEPGKLLKCPHYMNIHKSFRKMHMKIAMGNVLTMACTTLHLYYLACKLCALSL